MIDLVDAEISRTFRKGSRTYFWSSLFFPNQLKEDVFILYAFMRRADDYVDSVPQDVHGFESFVRRYQSAMEGSLSGDVVIDSFVNLLNRRGLDPVWMESFLTSMRMDTQRSSYATMDELNRYLYGSSEVIGLAMAQLLGLPPDSHEAARYLGKAMQYVNFIRDVDEDLGLGRSYFPDEELQRYGLKTIEPEEAFAHPEEFKAFMRAQIAIYREWQDRAETGYHFIPIRCLIPIRTAAQIYRWTATVIERDPFIVFRQKVKPSKTRVIAQVVFNTVNRRGQSV